MSQVKTAPLPIELLQPTADLGAAVHKLISECPPLDTNSMYCNLLQSSHFAETAVAAVLDNEVVGFISGYRIPLRPETLFVWQVAVGEKARGQGLAGRMLKAILAREPNRDIKRIETTITPDNKASWALFESLARKLDTEISSSIMFDRHQHFADQHDTEMLVKVGPFKPVA
ncbi:diaminobutyrate acetyltransferase [Methylophaga pinxianii]|uniref:diaminobutyrate acetyltransferase n=1 Tax=Methylophaga pinxianii TaxID=2881052 RepID=UPI001CF3D54E|nr:diaminobutyrate acetyltransferase [Methylophaga pinxianii]MCB2426184.1 diaminobutyrate acetyltransferase [Methylophaga pinxianii]UPH45054.1 diaminobutyrate acetyltransferase [Methylophaga pinxianii]